MEPLTLVWIGVLLIFAWRVDTHLRRIVATLHILAPQWREKPAAAATNTAAPAAPIPPRQPTGPVPLVHNFSGIGDRLPEVEILQRLGEREWASLGYWQEGHPDLEHGKRKGYAIRRDTDSPIEEGTE